MKKYIVTSALPYANGPLHFGHLAGVYIPADVFCRHKRMLEDQVIHISGSDEHGVAITLSAEMEGADYQKYVNKWHEDHKNLFSKLDINFDFFGRTSASYHKEEAIEWFTILLEKGFIEKRTDTQLYCQQCSRFLPDRYVSGRCYNCNFENARGDECPHCGEWIEATQLINPKCKICGSSSIIKKDCENYYLLLTKFSDQLANWINGKKDWRSHVVNFVESLIDKGLVDRAITRDLDWGIDLPLKNDGNKKLYVWFEAPIGYYSNTLELDRQNGNVKYASWWNDDDCEILHFIGKDNIIFHALIWPAMILGTKKVKMPTNVPASHFVNLEGKQFSKSTGWYVDCLDSLNLLGSDALRYYLISIIPENADTSFSWDDFKRKYDELSNKIGNFVNRSTTFLKKHWPEGLPAESFDSVWASKELKTISDIINDIRIALDKVELQSALKRLLQIGEVANDVFHKHEPWKKIKESKDDTAKTIALSLIYVFVITAMFSPFLPKFSSNLAKYFGLKSSDQIFKDVYLGDFESLRAFFKIDFKLQTDPKPLFLKIELETLDKLRVKN